MAVDTDCERYLEGRLALLEEQLGIVDRLAQANELTDSGLKITPLVAAVPQAAQHLIDRVAVALPHVKITELLLEVDRWTGFTRHFTHLKTGDAARDKTPLLRTILADAINLGLTKMAESCPGASYAKLSWLQAWHIRDETYGAALAELVNAQLRSRSLNSGAMAPRPPQIGSVSRLEEELKARATSTPSTEPNPESSSTPISPTNMRASTRRFSTSVSVTRPMCSTGFFIMSPTCGSKSTIRIRLASPTTPSL